MNKQNGFSALEIIMVVVIIGLVGAVGWLFYDKQLNNKAVDDKATGQSSSSTTAAEKANTLKTYDSNYLNLSFDYPATWTVKDNVDSGTGGTPGYNANKDSKLVVSPNGFTMFFNVVKPDGLGGICPPTPVSDFKLEGTTRLDKAKNVVSFLDNGDSKSFHLFISKKGTKADADNDSCKFNSIIEIADRSESDTPNMLSFGNDAIGETQISTQKPSASELKEAVAILSSIHQN